MIAGIAQHLKNVARSVLGQRTLNSLAGAADVSIGNLSRRVAGKLRGDRACIRTYWCPGTRNFGDLITAYLLRKAGITAVLDTGSRCQLSATGSILEMISPDFSGYVFGSGYLLAKAPRAYPNARVIAVRGALTRERIGAPENTLLGDPGLMVVQLLPRRSKKRLKLGIIPHHSEIGTSAVEAICNSHPDIHAIHVAGGTLEEVVLSIDECEYIISSSLHGLILADAFGIPSAWTMMSETVRRQEFKYHDYYSAYGETRQPVILNAGMDITDLIGLTQPPSPKVTEITAQLTRAWNSLLDEMVA